MGILPFLMVIMTLPQIYLITMTINHKILTESDDNEERMDNVRGHARNNSGDGDTPQSDLLSS